MRSVSNYVLTLLCGMAIVAIFVGNAAVAQENPAPEQSEQGSDQAPEKKAPQAEAAPQGEPTAQSEGGGEAPTDQPPEQQDQPPAPEETETSGDAPPADAPAAPTATAEAGVADQAEVDLTPSDVVPEGADAEAKADDDVEEIVVTGSRIRSALDKPAPVLQFSEEDIERTGLTSIADLLQKLPVSGGALNTKFNSSGNFGFPPDGGGIGAGAAQADLRNLGPKRVLVLVDGVRWVNGSSASGVAAGTDLNTIPIGIIDRIEILEDGASAIYGSDAIAGVVNIITKKSIDGFQGDAYVGGYHHGDGMLQEYNLTWGAEAEKTSMIFNLSFVDQNEVKAKDRDISTYPTPEIGACTGYCSSGTPQGRFYFIDPNTGQEMDLTINDGVGGIPLYDPTNPNGGDFHEFTVDDRFNYSQYNLVQTPSQRFGLFTQIEHELSDRVRMHVKALFNNRKSRNQAAPEPLFIGSEAGNGNRLDQISIDAANPYNPFGFTLDAQTMSYFIGRRPIENGPRIFNQNVNTWLSSGGFHGDFNFGDKFFYWDTTVMYAVNRADQVKQGGFNSAKLQTALGSPDLCAADPGCVPFNIFGGQGPNGEGTITPAMLDYVTFVQKDLSQQELFAINANITGDIIELPAGMLGFALGGEYRYLEGFFRPDPVVVAGDSAGVPSSPTSGEYDVFEAYAEMVVPILKSIPAVQMLDISGAFRFSNYSTFGTYGTFKGGARWKPLEDLLLRGSFAQGFRAPGIGELFGSKARYDMVLNDPCSDMLGLSSGVAASPEVQANCAALGVPADGSYEQFNQQISVTTGGNQDLDPETSKGVSASVVYSPWWVKDQSWADQLDLEVGYYWIELSDAISAIDAQVQIDACVQTMDDAMCQGISRTAGGVINGFSNELTNIGQILTDGLDINLTYLSPNTVAGRFQLISISTILFRYEEKIPCSVSPDNPDCEDGFQTIERHGRELGDPERAFPRFKSALTLGWALNAFGASLTTRYIHSVTEACRGFEDFDICSDYDTVNDDNSENKIDARAYVDMQVTWSPPVLDDHLNVTFGVNNLFNTEPPPCFSCQLNGFDATTYDVPGMFPYVRAQLKM
ncbi:MAG: TonB-dependent receptor [Myxococcota bacterium]|nr:TonB-dependent receptor [Myxococcota bacterium]